MNYSLVRSDEFQSWLNKLRDRRAIQLIALRVARLENGHIGDVRSIGNGIRELRLHYGPGYRIYFQIRGSEIILLLCGGDKGSQSRDIEQANRIAENWDR